MRADTVFDPSRSQSFQLSPVKASLSHRSCDSDRSQISGDSTVCVGETTDGPPNLLYTIKEEGWSAEQGRACINKGSKTNPQQGQKPRAMQNTRNQGGRREDSAQ